MTESDQPLRVGGDAVRVENECTTCHGDGKYEVTVFGPEDESGERQPEQVEQFCAVCNGTGKVWEYKPL